MRCFCTNTCKNGRLRGLHFWNNAREIASRKYFMSMLVRTPPVNKSVRSMIVGLDYRHALKQVGASVGPFAHARKFGERRANFKKKSYYFFRATIQYCDLQSCSFQVCTQFFMSKILYKKFFFEICYGFVTGESPRLLPPPPHQLTRDFVVETSKSRALSSDKTIANFHKFLLVQYFRHKELGTPLKWAWLNVSVLYGGPAKIIGFLDSWFRQWRILIIKIQAMWCDQLMIRRRCES